MLLGTTGRASGNVFSLFSWIFRTNFEYDLGGLAEILARGPRIATTEPQIIS